MAWAKWLFPVPGGPRNSASSCWAIKRPVARSWMSARFIFFVEVTIKAIERAIGMAEAGLFVTALEEPVLSTQELVRHQRRDEIDRRRCGTAGDGNRLEFPRSVGWKSWRDLSALRLVCSVRPDQSSAASHRGSALVRRGAISRARRLPGTNSNRGDGLDSKTLRACRGPRRHRRAREDPLEFRELMTRSTLSPRPAA